MIPHVLSIAGSDPSGGAGIQADLKTFSALGAYGMAAITALTAQNTRGVSGVHGVPPDFVADQVRAVFEDIRVDAVKTGMMWSTDIIDAVAACLEIHKPPHLVVDPVLAAQSGDTLARNSTISTIKERLIPLATVLTPNIPESEALLNRKFDGDMKGFAAALHALGPRWVLLKGGHADGAVCTDILTDGHEFYVLQAERIPTAHTHGTGCTLASALAVFLAKGLSVPDAATQAKNYVTGAIRAADNLNIGSGNGPVHHFHAMWSSK